MRYSQQKSFKIQALSSIRLIESTIVFVTSTWFHVSYCHNFWNERWKPCNSLSSIRFGISEIFSFIKAKLKVTEKRSQETAIFSVHTIWNARHEPSWGLQTNLTSSFNCFAFAFLLFAFLRFFFLVFCPFV